MKYQSKRKQQKSSVKVASSSRSLNVDVNIDLSRFLSWWGQGLMYYFPPSVRQLFWHQAATVVLEPQGDGVRIQRLRGENNEVLGFYDGVRRWDTSLLNEGEVLIFRLPAAQVLSKSIELPFAAEENLRQVLAFEMERHTPFTVNQVYYDFEVISRNAATRQITTRLVVAPQRILNEWLERLSDWGLQPAVVSVVGLEKMRINLLPQESRLVKSSILPRINIGLGVLLLVLVAAVTLLPLWQERNVVIQLMPKVATAQQQAEAVVAIRQQLEKAVEASEFLIKEKRQYPSAVEFLYELTHILPDSVWLQQLDFARGELNIRGEAVEASALIALLQSSAYMKNAQFRSPITTDSQTGRDRFHITAQIPRVEIPPS